MLEKRNLQVRILLLLGFIVFINFVVNTTAYYITLKQENFGTLINEVGALRKNTYAMAFELATGSEFNNYQELKDYQSAFIGNLAIHEKPFVGNDKISLTKTQEVYNAWFEQILPMFVSFEQPLNSRKSFTPEQSQQIYNFTLKIDDLVAHFEQQNGSNIHVIRSFNLFIVLFSIITSSLLLAYAYKAIVIPLKKLEHGLRHMSSGDFNYKIELKSDDEFGELAQAFNEMCDNIYTLHNELDHKVRDKTASLLRSKNALTFLYKTTALLHMTSSTKDKIDKFLRLTQRFTNANALCIRLCDSEGNYGKVEAQIGLDEEFLNDPQCMLDNDCILKLAGLDNCYKKDCPENKSYCLFDNFSKIKTFRLKTSNSTLGVLILFFRQNKEINNDNLELIELLICHLSIALENHNLLLENQMIEVFKERNRISQMLHDNIAQTLSYTNIQLQRLSRALANNDKEKQEEIIDLLNEAVKESYDDVRELLSNYRLNFTAKSFDNVIHEVCQSFTKRSSIAVNICNTSKLCRHLTELQIGQIYFILQESLANIKKHSKSSQVEVKIFDKDNFVMVLEIIDNGQGFEVLGVDKIHHFGLDIMKERALSIGAKLSIESAIGSGTAITLQIKAEEYNGED